MTADAPQRRKRPALIPRVIAWALRLSVVRAYFRYADRRGASLADSVTYRALFSIFAAVLLGFSLAALWLGGNPEAMTALTSSLDRVIPGLTNVVDPSTIDAPGAFSVVGLISLVGLVGAAISAIASLRVALMVLADELHDDGFFLWVLLRNLLVSIGFAGLLGAAAGLTAITAFGLEAIGDWLGLAPGNLWAALAARVLGVLTVLIINTAAIAFVFRMLSGVRAPARALWGGALLGGAGLVVLQELSGLFVRGATSNPLLASFAALIALLLWVNLSVQVILIASSFIITLTAESQNRLHEKYGAQTLAQLRRKQAEDLVRSATKELRAAQTAEDEERQAAVRRATARRAAAHGGDTDGSAAADA